MRISPFNKGFRILPRILTRQRPVIVVGAPDDSYYVLTKVDAKLANAVLHPTTGATGYAVRHDHTQDFTNVGTKTHVQIDTHLASTSDPHNITWAQINKTTSDIADITTKSHTSLTAIGTKTHTQIDTHLAAANPHSGHVDTTGAETIHDIKTFSSFPVTPFTAPTNDYEVANKKYVDDEDAAADNHTAGDGSDHADVASNTSASHTQNTDTALGAQSEDLDMNTNKIIGVVDPATDQEAATKKYVDDNLVSIPSGLIAMWSGAFGAIPAGWVVCDGNNGTPNLVDKFIRASAAAAGATGGNDAMAHTHTGPNHQHNIPTNRTGESGARETVLTDTITGLGGSGNTGAASNDDNKPAYYTLIFIMKT